MKGELHKTKSTLSLSIYSLCKELCEMPVSWYLSARCLWRLLYFRWNISNLPRYLNACIIGKKLFLYRLRIIVELCNWSKLKLLISLSLQRERKHNLYDIFYNTTDWQNLLIVSFCIINRGWYALIIILLIWIQIIMPWTSQRL